MPPAVFVSTSSDVPYVVVLVALDEGATMMTGLRECSIDAVHIGMRVEVTFEAYSDTIHVPYVRPADHS